MKNQTTPLSKKLNRDVFFGTSADLPQILELDLDQLVPNPDQPRKTFSEESLRELASSIKRSGVIQPIVVKRSENPRMFMIVAGERRWRASKIAELTTIPAVLTTGDTEELSLIENIQREDLNALEEAEALSRMMEKHHYTQEQLGAIVGKAQNTVSQTLALLSLPEKIRTEYHQSPVVVSKSMLKELARMKDAKMQLRAWEQMRQGKIATVRDARKKQPGSAEQKRQTSPKSAFAAGKRFVEALDGLRQAHDHALDSEGYRELLAMRDRIHELVEELSPTNRLLKS